MNKKALGSEVIEMIGPGFIWLDTASENLDAILGKIGRQCRCLITGITDII